VSTEGETASSPLNKLAQNLRRNEEQLFLDLALVIGVLVGLTIVAFVVLTERVGLRFYPVGSPPWRRLIVPVLGRPSPDTFFIAISPMLAVAEFLKRK
jgi:hypothetical protein